MKKNTPILPDDLKSGIESLSGHSMDDVKVHYNSAIPAQLESDTCSEGSDIHIDLDQEKHLPHEAWHIVQQKEGRIKPTLPAKVEVTINDDQKLENVADIMGIKGLQMKFNPNKNSK
ncbi:eCIS core domain-containing protein [Chryseobacterium ginsenosidimutans]|uniref:eCIS core domain-containing protein n=1 Tax=Chryseobacterium ginsenosidimutans TaxID=687846 RepID=UPI0031CF190A